MHKPDSFTAIVILSRKCAVATIIIRTKCAELVRESR